MMRILVIDSNVVFAKKVGEFLEEHLREAEIHYATDVPRLRRRLKSHHYDYLIADVFAAFDAEAMQEELSKVDIPMIVWAGLDKPDDLTKVFRKKITNQILCKPYDDEGIEEAVTSVSSIMRSPV